MATASSELGAHSTSRRPHGGSPPLARTHGRARALGASSFVACACLGLALGWGFSVDDALISTQVALNLARGYGHRFMPQGPIVDCVTPFGWQWLLSLFAESSSWQTLLAARWVSAGCWLLAAGLIGWRTAPWVNGPRGSSLGLLLAACLPLGAWAAAGMETGFVTLWCTCAMLSTFPSSPNPPPTPIASSATKAWLGSIGCAGLAAGLRPELLPWAVVLCTSLRIFQRRSTPVTLVFTALGVALPFLLVASCRWYYFGRPAPLAALAKPADLAFGLRYALGGALLTGPLWLIFGRLGPRRSDGAASGAVYEPATRAIALSLLAHTGSLMLVGGDWMALYRLWVPVLPGAFLIAALLSHQRGWSHWLRCAACLAFSGLLHGALGPDARQVVHDRGQLIAAARPHLAGAERVASVDVGWLSSATDAAIVDLGGATDAQVASLPGGHTSKQLAADFLWRREIDTLVLLAAEERPPQSREEQPGHPLAQYTGRPLTWQGFRFSRQVEQRLARLDAADQFRHAAYVPFGEGQAYHVFSSSPDTQPQP